MATPLIAVAGTEWCYFNLYVSGQEPILISYEELPHRSFSVWEIGGTRDVFFTNRNTGSSEDYGLRAPTSQSGAMGLYQFGRQRGLTWIVAHRDDGN